MMKRAFILFAFLCISIFSFAQNNKESITTEKPEKMLENFMSFWTYWNTNIILSEDFVGLDTLSKPLTKDDFFKQLLTGNFLPLRISEKEESPSYQLYKLDSIRYKDISSTIKNETYTAYKYYQMEGTELPHFSFTDINGNTYNKINTQEKIVVVKCWYIHCQACVAEMPALNELVSKYRKRKDIVFLSLAWDTKDELINFLKNTTFKYPVVADQENYIQHELLKTFRYPTHLIINKQGKIVKVINSYKELAKALEKEAAK